MSRRSWIPTALVTSILLSALITPVNAVWPPKGAPVCEATGSRHSPKLVSDGAGGVIVAWADDRVGLEGLYAQRLDGSARPVWTLDGVRLMDNQVEETVVAAISDAAGGAIFVYVTSATIYAQRVDATGATQWNMDQNGVEVAFNFPTNVVATSDGAGGVLIAWEEDGVDLWTQRIDASGSKRWAVPDGITVFTGVGLTIDPVITKDGSGGAVIAATSSSGTIRVQRIFSAGTRAWGLGAGTVLSNSGLYGDPAIAGDGVGGAYVVWELDDFVKVVYIDRVAPDGTTPWSSFRTTTNVISEQQDPEVIVDPLGNAVVCWLDDRDGGFDAYAQKFDVFDQWLWGPEGARVTTGFALNPRLVSGPGANVIVVFEQGFLRAQQLDPSGGLVWNPIPFEDGVQVLDGLILDWDVASDGAGGLLTTNVSRPVTDDVVIAQANNQLGAFYAAEPVIVSIDDVPSDQGGWVRLTVDGSDRDVITMTEKPAARYDVWREVQGSALVANVRVEAEQDDATFLDYDGSSFAVIPGGVWELLGSFSAAQDSIYQFLAPTYTDSSLAGPTHASFFVSAHTTDPSVWFASELDSGYSIDNIPPAVPMSFVVAYNNPGGNQLTWDPNTENDLKYYRVYRDLDPGFTPSPANYVHGTTSPGWTDNIPDGWMHNYKVTAVDDADNESDPTGGTTTSAGTPTLPTQVMLKQNVPNPFNPSTSIAIGLPEAGLVKLLIYDATGRLVRRLVDGELPAGFRSVTWQGIDDAGNRVSSGVYFYRLETAGKSITKKMVLVK